MRDPSKAWRTVLTVLTVVAYIGLIPMAVLCLLRIFHLESTRTVISLETFTFYLLLPAYVVLAFAAVTKQKVLVGCAAAIVLCHVVWIRPELLGSRSLPTAAKNSPRLTLYSQNVEFNGQTPDLIGQQIRKANADLVFLEELSTSDYNAMKQVGAFDQYQYTFVKASYGPTGLGIFSKYPLSSTEEVTSPGFPQMRAVVNINDKQLVLWNVHMRSPLDGPVKHDWQGDFAQLNKRIHSETQPTLVAGDFNATWGHRPFRNLLTHGYHEAAVDLGRGYSRTWPVDTSSGQSADGFIRLDHVIYNGGLQATHDQELPGAGSDHRAVLTTLALF